VSKPIEIKKEKYDYYASRDGEKIVTVCYILTEGGIVGRGISICSEQDAYDETIGKGLAQKHALRAIKGRNLDSIKRKEVINRLIQCKCPFTKKGERNPELGWWERRFLFGIKKMHEYSICGYSPSITFNIKTLALARTVPQQLHEIMQRQRWFEDNVYAKLIHQPEGE